MESCQEWKDRILQDRRTTEELVAAALAAKDDVVYSRAALVLQVRADRPSVEAALRLCRSGSAPERELGACVLGQMGDYKAFPDEVRPELLRMLREETHCEVLQSACYAVGFRRESAAVPDLARLSTHPNEDVRYAVTHGLLGQELPLAILTMIRLSQDVDEDVRNWATFGLGQFIELDTPEIRKALRARLDDDSCDVRAEALFGLALRREPKIAEAIRWELGREEIYVQTFDAAAFVGDPQLIEPLEHALETWDCPESSRIRHAIDCCSGKVQYEG